MKLVNGDVELDVKKYPMPVKGAAGEVSINGETVSTMFTSGRGNSYTYFRLKNVDLYVAGALDPDAAYSIELPENFGSEHEPAARKSYYVRKRPRTEDNAIPAGLGANAGDDEGAATTNPETGEAENNDLSEADPSGEPIDEAESVTRAPKSRRKKAE